MTKSELLQAGYGILGDKLFKTWSCYTNGIRRGGRYVHCGKCESCINRKRAFTLAQIDDRTQYAA
jgi:7-cyano-7-deazaguanine synthase